jgi:hypothetical protein
MFWNPNIYQEPPMPRNFKENEPWFRKIGSILDIGSHSFTNPGFLLNSAWIQGKILIKIACVRTQTQDTSLLKRGVSLPPLLPRT